MKNNLEKYIIIFFVLIFTSSVIYAESQEVASRAKTVGSVDTTKVVVADTIAADSLAEVQQDSLFYAADTVRYSYKNEQIKLSGNSRLTYHASLLKSDSISIDLKKEQAFTIGQSVMEDGSYLLLGEGISYDMSSEWGMINNGATKFEQGFCYGDEIRKIEKETFDIDNAIFTTCDALSPHFYVRASKLRLYKDDKIVAKPLIVYVNHLPIFALPFGTFTIKRGRESGFLVPSPSYNSTDGKVLRDIAYYQVLGPYADATLALDYYENTGWKLSMRSRYIKRYLLKGNFDLTLLKQISLFRTKYEWNASADHHQNFTDDAKFDANLNYVSSTSVWENSEDLDEREQEEVSSSVSYKRPLWGRTLSITGNYTDNLVEETKSINLPTVTYSLASKPIYELFYDKDANIPEYAWWKEFSYSYSLKASHQGSITDPDADLADVLYKTKRDSTGEDYINQHNAGILHKMGLSYSHRYHGWLDLSQSASYKEAWYDRDRNYEINNDTFVRGSDYSFNSSIGLSIYGLGDFPGDFIRAARHVVSPDLSFSYVPDFTHNEDYYSFNGILLNEGKKQRKLSFSLRNNWDLKLRKKKEIKDTNDDDKTEKLNNFFKISSSVSYDFENENEGYSDIYHSLSMNLKDYKLGVFALGTNPSGSITQEFYKLKSHGTDIRNWDYAVDYWSVSLTSKLSISGKADYVDYFPLPENRFESNKFFGTDSLDAESEDLALTLDTFDDMQSQNKSWSVNFNHTYQTNKLSYEDNDYTSNLRNSLSAKITKNWEVSYNNYINLKTKEIASHNFTITRDLHCWKIVFTYSHSTLDDYWNYRFRIFNIKLPNELKFRTSGHKQD